jgi:hypothetical protein
MSELVVMGATVKCTFGQGPGTATLSLLPTMIDGTSKTIATTSDNAILNISTFGMCTTASNPAVWAAQGAPSAGIPVITAPGSPGSSTVKVGGKAALTKDSTCNCSYGGVITVDNAGQSKITTG